MKKEKFLAELNKKRPIKKLALSMISDLSEAITKMKSFDLENEYSVAFTEYENALYLMEQAKNAADKYISSYDDFSNSADEHWEAYQAASDVYGQISQQLFDLGIDESPELSQYGDDLAEGETAGQKAFDQTQSEFSEHNELVDISNFN